MIQNGNIPGYSFPHTCFNCAVSRDKTKSHDAFELWCVKHLRFVHVAATCPLWEDVVTEASSARETEED